jgi:expansin (peptidoglycan-binding protein)
MSTRALLAVGLVLSLSAPVRAANVAIPATKLIVVDKLAVNGTGRTVYVAKDGAVAKGPGTDPAGVAATLNVLVCDVAAGIFAVPAGASDGTSGWIDNGASKASFANTLAPAGPTVVKTALVKPGKLLKLVAKGTGDLPLSVPPLPPSPCPVSVSYGLTNGPDHTRHCTVFPAGACAFEAIAGGAGAKMICKGGVADPTCAAAVCPADVSGAGTATYYDYAGGGACSFPLDPPGTMVAAINAVDWDGSNACGRCLRVTGPDGSVVVRIVDQCPECASGDLDLDSPAFAAIAPLVSGQAAISWQAVPCDVTGPVAFHQDAGSNPYYLLVQVRDHRYGVASLEYQDAAASSFATAPRLAHNYFEIVEPAGLVFPVTLRVTDVYGQQIVEPLTALAPGTTQAGTGQLPTCELP